MDETGVSCVHKPPKICTQKGQKTVWAVTSGEKWRTNTILACGSASGFSLPPMIIFPGLVTSGKCITEVEFQREIKRRELQCIEVEKQKQEKKEERERKQKERDAERGKKRSGIQMRSKKKQTKRRKQKQEQLPDSDESDTVNEDIEYHCGLGVMGIAMDDTMLSVLELMKTAYQTTFTVINALTDVFRITFICSAIPTVGGRVNHVTVVHWRTHSKDIPSIDVETLGDLLYKISRSEHIGLDSYNCLKLSVLRPPPLP